MKFNFCFVHKWYKLLRRDRQGKKGRGVALNVKTSFSFLEFDAADDRFKCFWVLMRRRPTKQVSWWEAVIDHPPG